jgi:hypothetical protein
MEVVGNDGQHVGTVDAVEGDRIKLTKKDDPDGSGQHHHYLAIGMVASVAGNQVRLNVDARMARDLARATGGDRRIESPVVMPAARPRPAAPAAGAGRRVW